MPNEYIEKFAYDSSGRLEYYGQAAPGSATSAAKWRIEKYTYSGIQELDRGYPSGDNANIYIWDNRATYTYS